MKVSLEKIQPDSKLLDELEEFAVANNFRSLGFSPTWATNIESFYKKEAWALIGRSNGAIDISIVGNYFPISRFGIGKLVSGAFLDHGGLVFQNDVTQPVIDEFTKEATRISKFHNIISKPLSLLHDEWPQSIAIVNTENRNEGDIHKSISSRARNDIKKARSIEQEVYFDFKYTNDFYSLYEKRMKEFGTPPHSIDYFKFLIEKFPNEAYLGVVISRGQVVAASFGISTKRIASHMYAVIDRNFSKSAAGDFLLYSEILRSANNNDKEIWLGRSLKNGTVELYKKKWKPAFLSTTEIPISDLGNDRFQRKYVSPDLLSKFTNFKFNRSDLMPTVMRTRIRKYAP